MCQHLLTLIVNIEYSESLSLIKRDTSHFCKEKLLEYNYLQSKIHTRIKAKIVARSHDFMHILQCGQYISKVLVHGLLLARQFRDNRELTCTGHIIQVFTDQMLGQFQNMEWSIGTHSGGQIAVTVMLKL